MAITAAPAIVSVHSAGGHRSQTVASLNQTIRSLRGRYRTNGSLSR